MYSVKFLLLERFTAKSWVLFAAVNLFSIHNINKGLKKCAI